MKKEKEYLIDNARLMSEWNWEENDKRDLDPRKLTAGSGKKPNWICSKGHHWDAAISHRVSRNSSCPYCSNKRILAGFNDLKSQYPELMKEWDFDSNAIDPSTVALKSNKIANWICPKGHKYSKAIYQRVEGADCPICMRARRTSFPEQCFFFYTKQVYPDAVNSYKEIFDNQMELDIYIPSIRTGIEYDGIFWHGKNAFEREQKKYRICKEHQIRLFRIKEGAFNGFSDVADRIWYIPTKYSYDVLNFYINEYLKFLTFDGRKLPDVNVKRDKVKIMEYKALKLEDSLLIQNPEVANEWHPTKNGGLTPDLFASGSAELIWWKCSKCGNVWKTSIVNRTKGHGCNKCANPKRKKTKKQTLLSKRGCLDKEWCLLDWDYELNDHGPEYYTNGSGEEVNWKCHVCGYRWKAVICDRSRDYKNGCPLCSGKVIVKGVNDLPTVRPDLMNEWNYDANSEIDPTTVGCGNHLYVSWKCQKCGYIWSAQVYNRANGKGCPCCANRVVVPGINDLATTHPELAEEWHPTMNVIKPSEVTKGQSKKIYWCCKSCGNVWLDTINHRTNGRGCSECKKMKHK